MRKTVSILGIDPGINNTGLSFNKYDIETGELLVNNYYVVHANDLAKKENRSDSRCFGNVFSLFLYEREMRRIITQFKPDYVASEDAFYSPRTPNAYVSLKLCIATVQRVLYTDFRQELHRVPPKLAKMAIGDACAGKVAVQEAILNHPSIKIKQVKARPVEKMTEHEADAIAIAYAFAKHILPDILIREAKQK
jgi:Holliday junction resolvasome RuvABC endonuclease subunit